MWEREGGREREGERDREREKSEIWMKVAERESI